MTIEQALHTALEHHRAGRLAQAEAIYREVLRHDPRHADALHLLGMLAAQAGHVERGIELIRQAITVAPDAAHYHSNLGNLLRTAGRHDEAAACFRESLRVAPDNAETWVNLSASLCEAGHSDEALSACDRVAALRPDMPEAHMNRAIALQQLGQVQAAIAACERAIQLRSDSADAHSNLGMLLRQANRGDEAVAAYRHALAIRPDSPQIWYNLANALCDQQQVGEAAQAFQTALSLQPDFAEAHTNFANLRLAQGRIDDALHHYRRAIALRPSDSAPHSALLAALHFDPGCDDVQLIHEHQQWAARHVTPLLTETAPPPHAPARKLRIGYVSPRFRFHVVGLLIEPLLRHHDRAAFEVFCYSDHPAPDAVTERLATHADCWRQTTALSDEQLARQIRDDGIDLLVDLNQHMANNRMGVFARKPAPVQAAYLGYAATTGLPAMDYRLTDVHMDPPGTASPGPEQLIHLPDCYWCYPGAPDAPSITPLPADSNGHITFGSMNSFSKVNPAVIAAWAEILRAVPASRLRLMIEGGRPGNEHVLDAFAAHAIPPERIDLLRRESYDAYLVAYNGIDIGLDPFPYNGGVTSLDAMWMGVPIITLAGRRSVGRAGVSLLMNLALPEFIAATPEQYARIAAVLAGDLPRLRELRATLRERMRNSPIMDAPRFARNVEDAYRRMCQRAQMISS